LYVHCSDAEIEGMACTEAFACGIVPIISDSKKSATGQFAITNESLFKAGDYLDLRDKIDYLLDNPHRKEELSKLYIEESKKYLIDNCVKQFENEILDKAVKKN
jgi:glycosyltransferase involved in cell wall biosynthesis